MSKVNRKRGASWYITNNGKIVYTYSEAEKKGYSRALFARALTALVEHGLIDIIKQGGGSKGDISLYAISERWVKYGTKDFEHKTRKKDTREGRGWAAFHSKQKKKSTTPETLSSKKVRPLVPKKIIKKR
jgi:DNA-binding PadR family transcriptional regulator